MDIELINRVKFNFKAHFGIDPLMVKAAGRINLIGDHVDYNEGYVFPAAIDKGIVVAISKSDTNECKAAALDFEESYQFTLDHIVPQSQGGWRNYLLGIISEIKKRNLSIFPFNMAFAGNIPTGSGLSSSAALENSIVFALNELFALGLDKNEMVLISQKSEHEFVGVKCGIMDQYVSMFGQKDHFLLLDCRSLETIYYPVNLKGLELVLINTNVQHTLSDSAYNDRRMSCEKVARLINKRALRDASEEDLIKIKNLITFSEYQKAHFVIQEISRTKKAAAHLEKEDFVGLGKLLFASHEGLSDMYEVSCKELDFLVDQASDHDAVIGARMMGGGFGGCTINLIKKDGVQNFVNHTESAYMNKFGIKCSVYKVKIAGGAELL